jgi:hypothetical protein
MPGTPGGATAIDGYGWARLRAAHRPARRPKNVPSPIEIPLL